MMEPTMSAVMRAAGSVAAFGRARSAQSSGAVNTDVGVTSNDKPFKGNC
jgi:hypothetical protein